MAAAVEGGHQRNVSVHDAGDKHGQDPNAKIKLNVWLEDRSNFGSYLTLSLRPDITFGEMKEVIWSRWKLPTVIQRWMVDKDLVNNDQKRLTDFNLPDANKKVYLYFLSPRSEYQTKQAFVDKLHPSKPTPAAARPKKITTAAQPRMKKRAEAQKKLKPQLTWKCPKCTYENAPMRPGCEICSEARPEDFLVPDDYELTREEMEILQKEDDATKVFQMTMKETVTGEKIQAAKSFKMLQQEYNKNLTFTDKEIHCTICMTEYPPGDGIILQNCLHSFCKECIIGHIQHSEEAVIKCPYQDDYSCDMDIAEYEIKAIASGDIYQKHLRRGLQIAENKDPNSFHCKTPDCAGWCTYEDEVNMFKCPLCNKKNCLTCKAIHDNMNCREYQNDLKRRAMNDTQAQATQQAIQTMLDQGNAMRCPGCGIVLQKKVGCDWMKCTMCKMELCWVTKGPRWGPGGKGDTSGGCRCGLNGKSCHPACKYCH